MNSDQIIDRVRNYYDENCDVIVRNVGLTYQAATINSEGSLKEIYQKTNRRLAERAGIKGGELVLDAGCGAGGPSVDLARFFPKIRINGVTLSEVQAVAAQSAIREAEVSDRVSVSVQDYHSLDFGRRRFDLALFFESLSYSYAPRKVFEEMFRVLKPGGRVYIKDVFKIHGVHSTEEEDELAELNKIYSSHLRCVEPYIRALSNSGFCDIVVEPLYGMFDTKNFTKKSMFRKGEFTDFGKSHFFPYEHVPVEFLEIKAKKPQLEDLLERIRKL